MNDISDEKTVSIEVVLEKWSSWENRPTAIELKMGDQCIRLSCIDEHHCNHLALTLTQSLCAHTVNPIKIPS